MYSGAGKGERSTSVIFEEAKAGRWVRARAVERPKTPEPRIRISFGGGFEAILVCCDCRRWESL
jgi:hypothetical protein